MEPMKDYTVGIICPLEVEMSAVRYLLDIQHSPSRDGNRARYICGELSGHNVVIATLPINAQGKAFTAVAAGELKSNFPTIVHFLLVGIGGGVPSSGVRLGDIVISTPSGQHCGVVQYDLGKQEVHGFVRKGYLTPPAPEWLDAISKMRSYHRSRQSKIIHFTQKLQERCGYRHFLRPPPERDPLARPTRNQYDRGNRVGQLPRADLAQPTIHYGLIASGDTVIKNAAVRDQIARDVGGAICFEMEAAGLMNHYHPLAIRGICDYADSRKNDEWHQYAAAAAAATAKEMLEYLPVRRAFKTPGPTQQQGMFSGTFNAQNGKMYNIGGVTNSRGPTRFG